MGHLSERRSASRWSESVAIRIERPAKVRPDTWSLTREFALIIAGGDASEILEPAKAAFDDVASLVGAFVEAVEGCSVGLVRNDGDCAAAEDVGAEGVTIVALVGDEYAHRRSEVQKGRRDGDVRILAGSEMECVRSAIRIA